MYRQGCWISRDESSGQEYQYRIADNTIVCECDWEGYMCSGQAKCHPDDTFSFDKGIQLATIRCQYAVAQKKLEFAKLAFANRAREERIARVACNAAEQVYNKVANEIVRLQREMEKEEKGCLVI